MNTRCYIAAPQIKYTNENPIDYGVWKGIVNGIIMEPEDKKIPKVAVHYT